MGKTVPTRIAELCNYVVLLPCRGAVGFKKKPLFPAMEEQTWDLTELQSSKDYLNVQLKGGNYAVRVLVG